jgi:hypothetical protein
MRSGEESWQFATSCCWSSASPSQVCRCHRTRNGFRLADPAPGAKFAQSRNQYFPTPEASAKTSHDPPRSLPLALNGAETSSQDLRAHTDLTFASGWTNQAGGVSATSFPTLFPIVLS